MRLRGMSRWGRAAAAALAFAVWTVAASNASAADPVDAPSGRVRGRVVDPSGTGIAGAEVKPVGGDGPALQTDGEGGFAFDPGSARQGRLAVRAPGAFAPVEVAWSAQEEKPLEIVLRPSLSEEVTVTAGRGETRLADTAARVVVLPRERLDATPALTVDDALRQVPGFTLFRRTGSRAANPTTQGSSLRGVGPSGASRTLVLLDGVPLNDPFGGWVYWSRLPRAALDRVEVMEGGASELYGSGALGGVVQALGRTDANAISAEASAGNEGTGALSAYGAVRQGDWDLRFAGEAFTTDGYVLVSDEDKGPVDTPAGASHLNGVLTARRRWGSAASAFARASVFGESRQNGTPLQTNDTDLQELSAGLDAPLLHGALVARGWYGTQSYRQSFTAVAADRASEALTRWQRVPTTSAGGSLSWSRPVASGHVVVAGLEARYVDGRSDETAYVQGRATSQVSAGGQQSTWAAFAEARLRLGSRVLATLGGRFDRWEESEGRSRTQPLTGAAAAETLFPARSASAVSPRASLLFRATPKVQLFASAYGAFRGPTLNELYRTFRVGDTLTQANPDLTDERLAGGEAGGAWTSRDDRVRARVLVFAARLEDPVANVTLRTTPALITRQRQNLGRTRSQGVEADTTLRLGSSVSLQAGYAFTAATVKEFAADPSLVGNDLPQVPRHQGTLLARYANPRLVDVSLLARASSSQFDDDQNRLPLAGFFSLDAQVARRFGRVEAFVAAENLTGDRYEVGRTPVLTLGPPRLLRAGLRFDATR